MWTCEWPPGEICGSLDKGLHAKESGGGREGRGEGGIDEVNAKVTLQREKGVKWSAFVIEGRFRTNTE